MIPPFVIKSIPPKMFEEITQTLATKIIDILVKKVQELKPKTENNGIVSFNFLPTQNPEYPNDIQIVVTEIYEHTETKKYVFGKELLPEISVKELAMSIDGEELKKQIIAQNFDVKKLIKTQNPTNLTDHEIRATEEEEISQGHSFTGTQPEPVDAENKDLNY